MSSAAALWNQSKADPESKPEKKTESISLPSESPTESTPNDSSPLDPNTGDSPSHAATILERIAGGDMKAVDDCVDKYGSLVWSLARRLCRSSTDAEDAAQEVFIELWEKANRFDPNMSSETTFISMIARRRLIDRIRRDKSRMPVADLMDFEIPDQSSYHDAEVADEARKALRCVKKLSAQQQRIIHLSIHQGESHSRISNTLKMPLGTVKSFARRALLQLRDCMSRSGATTSPGAAS